MSRHSLPSSASVAAVSLKRQEDGRCRHCGGPCPCWSIFGDSAPGRRHNRITYERMLEARDAESTKVTAGGEVQS